MRGLGRAAIALGCAMTLTVVLGLNSVATSEFITEFTPGDSSLNEPAGITLVGSDLWFAGNGDSTINKMTTTGDFTVHALPRTGDTPPEPTAITHDSKGHLVH
jgi:hypothetical protein